MLYILKVQVHQINLVENMYGLVGGYTCLVIYSCVMFNWWIYLSGYLCCKVKLVDMPVWLFTLEGLIGGYTCLVIYTVRFNWWIYIVPVWLFTLLRFSWWIFTCIAQAVDHKVWQHQKGKR
jgi:hypothetical protein